MAGSQPLWRRLFLGLAPFVLTLAAASVLILLVDRSPWEVFSALFQGAFGTAIKRADTAVAWVSVACHCRRCLEPERWLEARARC